MALRISDKKGIVNAVNEVAESSLALVAADYSGLTVSEIEKLRIGAKEGGVFLKVVRNTLARRALKGTSFSCVEEELKGPLILAFSLEEPSAAAKLIVNFHKESNSLGVKAIVVDGELLPASELKAVSKLPTKQEALSMLAGTLNAPVTKLAMTMNEVTTSLARVLNAYAETQASS